MPPNFKIISYPDPRLKKMSAPVAHFDDSLRELAAGMFVLMRAAAGVGLAAPQVAKSIRLFITNTTGKPEDDRVYINPILTEAEGDEEGEEGCLSIAELRVKVVRAKRLRIEALDLEGQKIDKTAEGFEARVWQHEADHLNGILLIDRMGPVAKIANRALLKELEEKYRREKEGKQRIL
ncbi:MAG TPA: peptide deformylase [Tepidisphaeraceae bacterium]|nr:peptide deformylase [Tepidisphaeraceae bacterium]